MSSRADLQIMDMQRRRLLDFPIVFLFVLLYLFWKVATGSRQTGWAGFFFFFFLLCARFSLNRSWVRGRRSGWAHGSRRPSGRSRAGTARCTWGRSSSGSPRAPRTCSGRSWAGRWPRTADTASCPCCWRRGRGQGGAETDRSEWEEWEKAAVSDG